IAGAGDREEITIDAPQASRTHLYVDSATLNGKKHNSSWADGSLVRRGGSLSFEVSDRANTGWATDPGTLPH
ncbi:glycoside hydrolase domain-containing protein, partial [Streptomyces yanii]